MSGATPPKLSRRAGQTSTPPFKEPAPRAMQAFSAAVMTGDKRDTPLPPPNDQHQALPEQWRACARSLALVGDSLVAAASAAASRSRSLAQAAEGAGSALEMEMEDSEAAAAAARQQAAGSQEALRAAQAAAAAAQQRLQESRASLHTSAAAARAARGERKACEAILAFELPVLRAEIKIIRGGAFASPEDPRHLASVMPLLRQIKLEDSLSKAFERAAKQRLTERTEFDCLAIDEVIKKVMEHSAAPAANVAPRAADVEAAEEAAKNATHVLSEASARASSLEVTSSAANAAVDRLQRAAQEATAARERVEAERSEAESLLEDFRAGPLAAFEALEGRSALLPKSPKPV